MPIERSRLVQVAESIRDELFLFPQTEKDLVISAPWYGRTEEEVCEAMKALREARLVYAAGKDLADRTVYQSRSECNLG